MMKKWIFSLSLTLFLSTAVKSQIGYQVSLLNSATGEPRANEQVTCHVVLSDKDDSAIWSEDITTTTNEFGVISLTVGNSSMFNNFKWAEKLPLYISVKIDDVLIGKSQVLNVPTAEYAKYSGVLTPEILCDSNLVCLGEYTRDYIIFSPNGTCTLSHREKGAYAHGNLNYSINGNNVLIRGTMYMEFTNQYENDYSYECAIICTFFPNDNVLYFWPQ
jgi:hypothetical protein